MKKLIMLTIFLLLNFDCYSQTIQPSKQKLDYFGNSIFLDEHSDFHQSNFVFGWHWYNGYKMSSALGINQIHVYSEVPLYTNGPLRYLDPDIDRIAHNSNMIVNTPYIGHHWHPGNGWFISHNIGFMYEPTYEVNTSNPAESFLPRKYDTTRYAFGFANVKGFVDTTQGAENYNRLQLFDNDSIRNQIVLSEPWISNGLKTIVTRGNENYDDMDTTNKFRPLYISNIYNKPSGSTLDSVDRLYNVDWKGVNFYFNINLRRLNTIDTLTNNDTILEIRLPYTTDSAATFPRQYGLIRFDSLPKTEYNELYSLPNGRGLVRKVYPIKGDTVIYITRSMLPKGNETNKDITISAFFVCDNNKDDEYLQHNYGLKGFPFTHPNEQIDSLKIEVKYRGNCDVGIDFISITTRPTRELMMGYFDNTIKNKMQESLDSLTTTKFTSKGIKPYRWYLVDEAPPLYWITRHYFTKLLGKIYTFEGGEGMPQFYYYCNNAENWFGQGGILGWKCVPYIPRHKIPDNPDEYLKKNFGWPGETCYDFNYEVVSDSVRRLRIKNSNYETITPNNFNYYKESRLSPLKYGECGHGLLLDIEMTEYNSIYNTNHNQYLFDSTNWWGQIWIEPRMQLNVISSYSITTTTSARILTGEEFRYFFSKILLYGGKGIIQDGEAEYFHLPKIDTPSTENCLNLHHGQKLVDTLELNNESDWDFLNNDAIGGDFLSLTDTNEVFVRYMEMDTIAKYLHIDKNRYYVGRKSMRLEFKKGVEFVKQNENTLMNLQLVAAQYKGFQKFYVQDPKITQNEILNSYIQKDNIKTRPLNRIQIVNGNTLPYYENEGVDTDTLLIDSSLYHITLLKSKTDTNMSNQFYIGVLNTRTGPHIVLDSSDCGSIDSLVFLSTAELIDSIKINPNTWSKYYWKRLGCREITIPFNYKRTANDKFCLLRVTELAGMDSTIGTWQFRHNVDTVIAQDASISVNFLPGEGKLFRIEIIEPDSVNGYLAHSNQTKMVAHNELDAMGAETENIRYHLVYHKPDLTRNNLSTVYYVRSQVITPSDKNKQIQWEMPLKVSNTLFHYQRTIPNIDYTVSNLNCYYPSITVRKVGTTLKAFIVYQAKLPSWGTCYIPCNNILCSGLKNPIIETQLNVGGLIPVSLPTISKVIVPYNNGDVEDNYINPVISSASNGNYYSWSDSICGIGIGFKPATVDGLLTTTRYIKANYSDNIYKNAYHPSLNPYMNENDSEVPLVWEQDFENSIGNKNINYTILKLDMSGSIYNAVPANLINRNPVKKTSDNSIIEIETPNCISTFPVVQRTYLNTDYITRCNDNILWNSNSGNHSGIIRRNMILGLWGGSAYVSSKSKIYESVSICISQPIQTHVNHVNVAQSSSIKYIMNERTNVINDDLSIDYDITDTDNNDNGIKAIDLNSGSILPISGTKYSIPVILTSMYLKGKNPQLSKSFSPSGNDTWKNRRVNELPTSSIPLIVENAKTFLKTSAEEVNPDAMFGYVSYRTKLFIDLPKLDDEYLSINLPYTEITDSIYGTFYLENESDTIYSDWFTVGSSANLKLKVETQDTLYTKLAIQKQSDSTYQTLGLPSIGTMFDYLGVLYYILVNGQNEQYRLCLINLDTMGRYEERYYVNGLPMLDTVELSKRSDLEKDRVKFVELNPISSQTGIQINIYPNPADEKIYVSAYLPIDYIISNSNENNQLEIIIVTSIGSEIYKGEISSGETKAIETTTYPNGIYFVKISKSGSELSTQNKMFIIKR